MLVIVLPFSRGSFAVKMYGSYVLTQLFLPFHQNLVFIIHISLCINKLGQTALDLCI